MIGVNTAIYTSIGQSGSIGIGLAIPGNDARAAAEQLRKHGHLRLGWLGLRAQDVTPNIADAFGSAVPYGAVVVDVEPDGAGAHARVQVGHVIVQFGKQATRDARALARIVASATIGEAAPVTIWRDRKELAVTATVGEWAGERPPVEGSAAKQPLVMLVDRPDLGLLTAAITDELRTKYKLAMAQTGVVITGATPRSAADESGLAEGEVILRVQQDLVTTTADLMARFNEVRAVHRHHVVLLVQNQQGLRWIPLYVGAVQ